MGVKKIFEWDEEKNKKLIQNRGVSFEAVAAYIEGKNIIGVVQGKGKFSHQKQFLIAIDNYVYIVPCVEDGEKVFLKTIIPSRKMTRRYLLGGS